MTPQEEVAEKVGFTAEQLTQLQTLYRNWKPKLEVEKVVVEALVGLLGIIEVHRTLAVSLTSKVRELEKEIERVTPDSKYIHEDTYHELELERDALQSELTQLRFLRSLKPQSSPQSKNTTEGEGAQLTIAWDGLVKAHNCPDGCTNCKVNLKTVIETIRPAFEAYQKSRLTSPIPTGSNAETN